MDSVHFMLVHDYIGMKNRLLYINILYASMEEKKPVTNCSSEPRS